MEVLVKDLEVIVTNKKARHDYFILEVYEAGLKLLGSEIKSVRLKKVNIDDSFVTFKDRTPYVTNMHISKYAFSSFLAPNEKRPKELLLHKREIIKLKQVIKKQSLTLIPLKLYITHGLAKLEIGLAKGKNVRDKRQDIKERDDKRYIEKVIKRGLDR